jgi:ATP-dependent Clp protease ATP-binding subunit ClpA
VLVDEPTIEQTIEILKGVRKMHRRITSSRSQMMRYRQFG